MRYPNRLYAVEGGDLHFILSGPPEDPTESEEYREFMDAADRREAEIMADLRASLDRHRRRARRALHPAFSVPSTVPLNRTS